MTEEEKEEEEEEKEELYEWESDIGEMIMRRKNEVLGPVRVLVCTP